MGCLCRVTYVGTISLSCKIFVRMISLIFKIFGDTAVGVVGRGGGASFDMVIIVRLCKLANL